MTQCSISLYLAIIIVLYHATSYLVRRRELFLMGVSTSTYMYPVCFVVFASLSHFPSPSRIHSVNMTSQWPLTKFEAQMNKTNPIQQILNA